jgi:hypothetical protein
MSHSSRVYSAFGARWHSDLPLPQFDILEARHAEEAIQAQMITVRAVAALAPRTLIGRINRGYVCADGFRLAWRDEVTFDVQDRSHIDYLPGPAWRGTMPSAFYSTVTALTLALQDALPFHASALEVDGKAVLIVGVAGAGKSTLIAALLEHGGRMLGDDLTIVRSSSRDGPFIAARGRPGIRLHAATAARVAAFERYAVPSDDRGKWLVRPVARSSLETARLAGVVVLGRSAGMMDRRDSAILLGRHLFRSRWLAALPGHAERLRTTLAIAGCVNCCGIDPGAGFHRDPRAVDKAWGAIAALLDK